ncbi:hypothetical protein JTE90_008147, partial [Oedothorax gibbosus]
HPAHLYLELSILDIDRIEEGRMEFSLQMYIEERWNDWRLNLSSYVGENAVSFPQTLVQDLWVPDLVFDNAKSGVLFDLSVPNTNVAVYEDGSLARTSRYNLVISCHMNFLYYPMDTQLCFIKMALLSNPDNKVTLHWGGEKDTEEGDLFPAIRFANEVEALKYRIDPPKTYTTQEQWATGNYSYLYANFTFVRLISGSLMNTISDVFPPDYNKHESPGYQGHPAHVYLELIILDIDRIDESRMEFSIQTYIEERWNDWRLNLSSYVGECVVSFPQALVQDLWVPDLMFDNAKSGVLFDLSVPNTIVEVYKDGSLGRSSR